MDRIHFGLGEVQEASEWQRASKGRNSRLMVEKRILDFFINKGGVVMCFGLEKELL